MSGSMGIAPAGVRVLIVDDDARIRRQTAIALSRAGFTTVTADDGAPAIAQAEVTPPDLVLVDLGMPTCGYEVVRRLKARYGAAVHVTVLSGRDDEAARAAAFDAGADDFVAKPASSTELRRRLVTAARTQQAFIESRLARDRADRLLAYGAEASAMLAHDLNNGLAVALGNLTHLAEVAPVSGDEKEAMVATLRALRRMSGLVANFVDIARFEDAAVRPRSARVGVRDLFLGVLDVHAPSLGTGSRSVLSCAADLAGNFDASLIERVLHNLVGNAFRYCPASGEVRLTGRTWDPADQGSVELSIQNTGPAIPNEVSANLFAKYSKGANGKRGMGLYFCRLACEAHGGRIDHVAHDDGPMFVIRLPGRT